jgi:RNA polymerase sigma factor for flagellar operon FliA
MTVAQRDRAETAEGGAQGGIDELWERYKATGDPELRNRLLVHYAPLVKYVAGRVGSGLPQTVDRADLVSDGIFGLVDAIEKFDPARGLAFQTYAVPRIKGAIIDALRAMDWVPRSVRNKIRDAERVHGDLQMRRGRTPSDQEVADEMKISVGELREIYAKASCTSLAALDDLVDDVSASPGEALEDDEERVALLRAVRRLPPRDQVIVALYYYEGFTLAAIGRVLQISESRVSQLHTRVTVALRARLMAQHAA